jgi:hypothetical protein
MARSIVIALSAATLASGLALAVAPVALAQVVGSQSSGNQAPEPGDDLVRKKIEATLMNRGYDGFTYAWPQGDGWRVQAVKNGSAQMVWVDPQSGQIVPQGMR